MSLETKRKIDCKTFRSHLPDLLLEEDYAAAHPELARHLEACADCSTELNDLRATLALLAELPAPEPSLFFDSKLRARLRETQASEPEGLWERMRSFLLFSTGRSFRPAVAGALALVLLAGGGAFVQTHSLHGAPAGAAASATVNDLKILDNNAQAEQQMGQLLDESGSEDGGTPPTS